MMQSSPPRSEGKARAIRELSRSMNGHSTHSIPSPSPPPSDSNPTQQFDTSDFLNNEDVLHSTQHRFEEETNNTLPQHPRIRSTAKKVGRWEMNRSELPMPDTSMVNKEFGDFDGHSLSDEEDISIEQARGNRRSNKSTPAKANSSFKNFDDSLYNLTPASGRARKSYAAETGSLRKDAQIRRASRNDMEAASPRPESARHSPALTSNHERKRMSLAQSHAKVSEDESSFVEERPPTLTFQSKSTRWGGPRSRQTSLQMDGATDTVPRVNGTSRSRPVTAQGGTAQSFMLPDLPNLTELVSGIFQDGTPVFSKTTPARSRFTAPSQNGRGKRREPNYIPIDNVPIPDEEKAIFAALQLLQEKVAQLEHDREEAEIRIEEQEVEIIELKSTNRGQDTFRRVSNNGDAAGKNNWNVEKTRLETSVHTLQKKLERSDRKLSIADIEKNRLQKERDSMATQLTVAFQNFDELKAEKEALSAENETLRQEIDALRDQLDQEQQQYREETLQLRRNIDRADTQREADALRVELSRARARHDETTQQLARKEAEVRAARKEQADYAKLKADNDALKTRLEELRAKREQEFRRWTNRENELKSKVNRRDETIRHFQGMTQEQTNEAVRMDNENLRQELDQLNAQYDDEASRWAKKEDKLMRKIDTAKEKEGLTREILGLRQANDQQFNSGPISADKEKRSLQRRPSVRREDTQTRIANRVQQEVRNSKVVSSSYIERSPRKSAKISVTSRSVSAPLFNKNKKHAEVDSDVESTTDLSLEPHGTSYVMSGGATGMPKAPTVEAPAPLDLTELSYIDADQIAQLRRALEEERAGLRSESTSAPVERQTREDTGRSAASAKSTRPHSLPRKSSMKDITERTTGTVFEDLTGRVSNRDAEPTQTEDIGDASMISNTSRRRRSAPAENMTSAFIVPDIKIDSQKEGTTRIEVTQNIESRSHDNDNCTVCRREATSPPSNPLQVPKLVPVSSRMPDDVDATIRPAHSPKEALALVVKELLDERAHLHLELATCRAMLEAHDASSGMKKRTRINDTIKELLSLIEVKDTQIYHLYDVLEGQNDHEITELEVEELTREIRVRDQDQAAPEKEKKAKSGKKVTVRSFHESEDGVDASFSADEEDLPWEGFEDTSHSVRFDAGVLGRRRSSVGGR